MFKLKRNQKVIAEKVNGHFAAGVYLGYSAFKKYRVLFASGEIRSFKNKASIIPNEEFETTGGDSTILDANFKILGGRHQVLAMIYYRQRKAKGEEV